MLQQLGTHTYRAVFISDVHLGLRESRADLLVDFLQRIRCEQLYFVGDIVDGWRLRRSWYWNAAHDLFVRLVLKMAHAGVDITYIPGNHDEALRDWLGLEIAGIRVARRAEHRSAGGLRILVTHGDQFDDVVRCAPFLATLGDRAYDIVVRLNHWLNAVRRHFGFTHWSLAQWTKQQLTAVMTVVRRYEDALATEAGKLGFDGVVCGHIHCPAIRRIGRTLYMNAGDWVESCTTGRTFRRPVRASRVAAPDAAAVESGLGRAATHRRRDPAVAAKPAPCGCGRPPAQNRRRGSRAGRIG
jgi:UDP-2,3-diacylglucosamine pyrophosphatase LpxH